MTHLAEVDKSEVQESLLYRLHNAAHRIRFEFESDGRIILEGRLSSYYEKQLAQEAVRCIDSVTQISNRIVVD